MYSHYVDQWSEGTGRTVFGRVSAWRRASRIFADKAYQKKERIQTLRSQGVSVKIHRKARKGEKLSKRQEEENRKRSKVRSKTEHPFHIIKNLFGWKKVRYRGPMKNTEHFFGVYALANLSILKRKLLSLHPLLSSNPILSS